MSYVIEQNIENLDSVKAADAGTQCKFAIILTACFSVICALTLAMHEMWRDELQAWMIARDSNGIVDMLRALKLEGHPPLWYLLLYVLTRITHDPRSMQFLTWAIATGTVFLVAKFAPFTKLQRTLFAFSYYPLFEFGVISRDYGPALFAAVLGCIGYRQLQRDGKTLLLSVAMVMMALLTIYTLIFVVCLVIMIAFRCVFDPELKPLWLKNRARWLFAASVMTIICALSAIQMQPPPTSGFAVGWHTQISGILFAKVIGTVWKAYFPIPRPVYDFWNSNILQNRLSPLQPLLGMGILASVVMMFRRNWPALLLFVMGTSSILAFEYLKYFGYARHHGWLLVLFVVCLWIAYQSRKSMPAWAGTAFTVLLVLNCAASLFAVSMDWLHPFSDSMALADYLQANQLANMEIVGHWDASVSPLSAWLQKPVYFAETRKLGTYIHWDGSRSAVSDQQAADLAVKLADQRHEDVLLVLTPDPDDSAVPTIESTNAQLIRTFVDAIIPSERYWLYRVVPDRPSSIPTETPR